MTDKKVSTVYYKLDSKPEAKCCVEISHIEGQNNYTEIGFKSYNFKCAVFRIFPDNRADFMYEPMYEVSERRLYSNTTAHQLSAFLREIGIENVNYYTVCSAIRNGCCGETIDNNQVHCLKSFVKNYEHNGRKICTTQYSKRLERNSGIYGYYY